MREQLNTANRVLAIDPGLSGAAALCGLGIVRVCRDFKSLGDIAHGITHLCSYGTGVKHTLIELVGARPGQGVCSMFSFGKSTGVALGALFVNGHEPEQVSPQKWQNFYRTRFAMDRATHPVFDSRSLATALLPEYADLFKRKKDHNTADAVLMALWKLAQLV